MPNVTLFPLSNIDMQLGEVRALLDILISIGENAEDAEYARLRAATVSTLYALSDKLAAADRSVAQFQHRRAS